MSDDRMTRRTLLGVGAGVAAGSVALAALADRGSAQGTGSVQAVGRPMPGGLDLPATPPRPPRPGSVGFVVVGLGDYALRQMMPRFANSERAHVAALVSGNPAKLAAVGDAYGVPADARYGYDRFDAIRDDRRIEAAYIVLPSGLHADWSVRAFAAGKHVLCEKPMALSSAEAARMIAAARRADRRLMIAYRSHFEPHNLRAMELTRTKALGDLRYIRSEQAYRTGPATPQGNWRLNRALAGRGPIEDLGIYGLQAALYLSGEMPESVSAHGFRPVNDPRFTEILAQVSSQLRFPSGVVAQLNASYDGAGRNFYEARGTTDALVMDPATNYVGQRLVLERSERVIAAGDPQVQFARQLDHLAAAIRDGAAIRTPGEMGLRDLRLIEAIHASVDGNGRTIALNPDGTMRG